MAMVIAFPVMPRDPRGSICPNVCCSDLARQAKEAMHIGLSAVGMIADLLQRPGETNHLPFIDRVNHFVRISQNNAALEFAVIVWSEPDPRLLFVWSIP